MKAPWTALALLAGCASTGGDDEHARASELAQRFIITDGHIDVPYRMTRKEEDISARTPSGEFDWVRAREGGLDAPFMSIYVPASYEEEGGAKDFADGLIDMVEGWAERSPGKFVLATTADEIEGAHAAGRVALLMGMENGSPVEGELANVDHFFQRGVRYITLCHSKDNHLCDSSYDQRYTAGGLTPFGEKVVRRMNELGMLVDISHVSDEAFYDVMALTESPAIASHSSLRHFTPGFERNMSDEMVKALAENGGVVQINFGSSFIDDDYRQHDQARREAVGEFMEARGLERDDPRVQAFLEEYLEKHPKRFADVEDVADHIDRAVALAGIDHVGLGSDFDGVGDSLPTGLKDVSMYPNLIACLLERGYTEGDIEKICSGNVLRVMRENERIARELARSGGR